MFVNVSRNKKWFSNCSKTYSCSIIYPLSIFDVQLIFPIILLGGNHNFHNISERVVVCWSWNASYSLENPEILLQQKPIAIKNAILWLSSIIYSLISSSKILYLDTSTRSKVFSETRNNIIFIFNALLINHLYLLGQHVSIVFYWWIWTFSFCRSIEQENISLKHICICCWTKL